MELQAKLFSFGEYMFLPCQSGSQGEYLGIWQFLAVGYIVHSV